MTKNVMSTMSNTRTTAITLGTIHFAAVAGFNACHTATHHGDVHRHAEDSCYRQWDIINDKFSLESRYLVLFCAK